MKQPEPTLAVDVKALLGNQLFQHLPASVAVIDQEFRVVLANGPFARMFGAKTGQYCYEIYKKRDRICDNCQALKTFKDGEVRVVDEQGVDRDGRPTHYVVHMAPLYDDVGNIAYVVEMSYDVTKTTILEQEYRTLFEQVPCYVAVLDSKLRIMRANKQLRDTFGQTKHSYCYQVFKDRNSQCPDCPVLKVFGDGQPHISQHVGVTEDGELKHYIVSAMPLRRTGDGFEHVIEMGLDVTETHELSRKLLRESAFRHTLTENALDALVATDENGAMRIFNPAAETLFGFSTENVLDTKEAGRFYPEPFQKVLSEGGSSLTVPEILVTDMAGNRIPVRFSGTVLKDEKGNVIGGSAFFQDLREIKRLEEEKMERQRLATVGETVAEIAHAIKNILTGLQGGMHKLRVGQRQSSQAKIDRGWEMLDRNFDRVTVLVKGLLNLSKHHVPQLRTVDVREIVEEVCRQFRLAAAERKISLACEPPPEPVWAHVDSEDLHTCLSNLVSNAIDACAASEKADCTVTVRASHKNGTTVFEITDTGCGMDNDVLQKAFDVFYSTKGIHGTGLGLAVTRKIVTEHGGTLEVDSRPGQGSTFRIILPRPTEQNQQDGEMDRPTAADPSGRRTIDDPTARRRNNAKKDSGCG